MAKTPKTYDEELDSMMEELSVIVDKYVQKQLLHVSSAITVLDIVKRRLMDSVLNALKVEVNKPKEKSRVIKLN